MIPEGQWGSPLPWVRAVSEQKKEAVHFLVVHTGPDTPTVWLWGACQALLALGAMALLGHSCLRCLLLELSLLFIVQLPRGRDPSCMLLLLCTVSVCSAVSPAVHRSS